MFDGKRDDLLHAYYYTLGIEDSCNNCFACVGMCPTGALKIDRQESGAVLAFNASFCGGCGLCEAFCRNSSASVRSGFSGDSPFDFRRVRRDVFFETRRQESEF
jgi:Pyruvate/2-oxoacid:ferredoxin oxidoreductase delta subunit